MPMINDTERAIGVMAARAIMTAGAAVLGAVVDDSALTRSGCPVGTNRWDTLGFGYAGDGSGPATKSETPVGEGLERRGGVRMEGAIRRASLCVVLVGALACSGSDDGGDGSACPEGTTRWESTEGLSDAPRPRPGKTRSRRSCRT